MINIKLNCNGACIVLGHLSFSDGAYSYALGARYWHGGDKAYGKDIFGIDNPYGMKRMYEFYWNTETIIFPSRKDAETKMEIWKLNNKATDYEIMSVEDYIKWYFQREKTMPKNIDIDKYIEIS